MTKKKKKKKKSDAGGNFGSHAEQSLLYYAGGEASRAQHSSSRTERVLLQLNPQSPAFLLLLDKISREEVEGAEWGRRVSKKDWLS